MNKPTNNILTIWIRKRDTDDRWHIDSRRLETERKKKISYQLLSKQKREKNGIVSY